MDHGRRSWRRAVARLAIGGLLGAPLVVFGSSPNAMAATVSHFNINNASVTEGDAGTVNITFTISYTGTKNNISVDWATANGTAIAGADFVASSGTATFTLAGPTSQTITVAVNGDLLDEANETFTVNLTNPQPPATADITTPTGIGTINDNDPLPSIVISDVSLTEGNAGTTNADFTVTLSAPSGRNVTVNYATANSSATQPGDYTSTPGTLTFTPGQVTKAISVPVVGDTTDEIDETYFVNLSGATNATIADTQGLGTIVNDDTAPSLTINDVSLTEGNAGTANMTFTATLSAASGKTVTVAYASADGTATAPADYTSSSGTLTFNPGVLTRTFTIPVVGDTRDEFDETFFANLSGAVNATIADNQGVGTIVDNDPVPGLVINNVTVTEVDAGTVTATFTVTQSAASGKTVSVDYATSDVTAMAPADYAAASGTLTFAPGVTTRTIAVAVQGDLLNEANETYRVMLSNPVNATITTATGTGTITDNDPLPSIVIDDPSIVEGNAGTTNVTFTLTLSAASGRVVTVRATTANGTATQPADYTSTNLIVTFPAGSTTQTYSVPVVGDVLNEADDTFVVNLTTPTNSTIADAQGIGAIVNDDALPMITINDVSRVEGNAGTANLTFTLTLSPVSGRVVTVDYTTTDLTASAPGDYTTTAGTITFNAGTTTRTISVPIVGDTVDEFDETFAIDLTSPLSATLLDSQGIGTITDNDAAPSVSVNSVMVTEGDAGTTTASFVVALSAASGKPISVDYATADGTATAPSDYAGSTGTLNVAPGQTSKTVDVAVNGDTIDEFDETFTLGLSNLANVTAGTLTASGTIVDDDPFPTVSVADVSLAEGDVGTSTATFAVSLSAASGKPISVDYATADGTATSPSDYASVAGTLNFAPGQTAKTVDVAVSPDQTYENDETFAFSLSNLMNVAAGGLSATGTIRNDDALPQLSVDDQSVTEGDAGTTTVVFTVSFPDPSAFGVSVDYQTNDGSAGSPADYTGVAGTLTFTPGETTKTVAVNVNGDAVHELDETFALDLSNPSGGAIADGQGMGTIVNDDALPVLDMGDTTVPEGDVGDATASFTLTLAGATQLPVTVDVATADQTATAGIDYEGVTTTITFAPGETTKVVNVTVHGDTTFELDETFTAQLSNPTGTTIVVGPRVGTILNDDSAPGLVVSDVSIPEGNSGDTLASFTVAIGTSSGLQVAVDIATQDDTATQPSDYDAVATTLTFAPGETAKTLDIIVHGDTLAEQNETFAVLLSNANGASITDGIGEGTIANDDAVSHPDHTGDPVASIGDASIIEGGNNTTTTLSFPVTLSKAAGGEVTINYRTGDGSAIGASDYSGVVGSLRIPAGYTAGRVRVTVIGDDRPEPDETFALEITGVTGAQAGSDGTGTIVNDDREVTRITLRAKGHHHRIVLRGRMLHAEPGMRVRVVLLEKVAHGYVRIARDIVRISVRSHHGVPVGVLRDRFTHLSHGRYVVRAVYRGDAIHLPARARAHVRL